MKIHKLCLLTIDIFITFKKIHTIQIVFKYFIHLIIHSYEIKYCIHT